MTLAVLEFLQYDFMRRALLVALLVGLSAPAVGIFLVQRRLALIGDGLGHVAVTGVALGLVLERAPVFLALVAAVTGAVALEYLRSRKGASADLALALLFYGGIAGGLVLVSRAPAGTASLNQYLFGSITTTTNSDLVSFAVLAVVVIGGTLAARPALFAVSNDEEFAIARGLPVRALNMALAIFVAVAVVLSMRIIGVLLVGALMVVPVATAQHLARSFRGTHFVAMAVGACTAVGGVVGSYYFDTPSGATIVLLAIGLFGTVMTASTVRS